MKNATLTAQIKTLSVRDVVASELTSKAKHKADYDLYTCPFHDDKTPSFMVKATYAKCFTCHPEPLDAIGFIREYHNYTFSEAVQYLADRYLHGVAVATPTRRTARTPTLSPSEPPANEWQQSARAVIADAEAYLWSTHGGRALSYLRSRGFDDKTIKQARLGYIPGKPTDWINQHGLSVPAGILIPWVASGAVWALKVRRSVGTPKYQQVKGGNLAGALYLADNIKAGKPLVITEGEFDALVINQFAMDFYSAVALGSASNADINIRWYAEMVTATTVYLLMDPDKAGALASERLARFSASTRIITPPEPHHDINEMLINQGVMAVIDYLDGTIK